MSYEMSSQLRGDVVTRLVNGYGFVEKKDYLRNGRCPACQKKEAFVSADAPWMVKCGRESKCGQTFHIKELFPELFETWSERFGQGFERPRRVNGNGNAAQHVEEVEIGTPVADAYLSIARGFDLEKISGWYSQEYYMDDKGQASATVRFPLPGGYWERLIDKPERFGKKKARFKYGLDYKGTWWCPPEVDLTTLTEIWLVEGIFDSIALYHHDIVAPALFSCYNYPELALQELREAFAKANKPLPKLVWALDNDRAGQKYLRKFVARAREEGWNCSAALVPQYGKGKADWNDAHQRDELTEKHLDYCRYIGELAIARSAIEKAVLMYNRTERMEFHLEFGRRLYWFKLDLEKYEKEANNLRDGDKPLTEVEIRDQALKSCGAIVEIANCHPTALYYQANTVTDESWYYFRVEFPHDSAPIKNTFSGGQLAASSEFKKRLLGIAPGAIWTGTSNQLDRLMRDQLTNIKTVETIDYIGYSRQHETYVFGDLAVKDGKTYQLNDEDFFDIGKLSLKSLSQSVTLTINKDLNQLNMDWPAMIAEAFGSRGVIALAYWLGALFAEQIRSFQQSYPFLEIIGEAGAGKSTLIEFMWKLVGRLDQEGFDPSKATPAARARIMAQVSNLPVVLIEADREQDGGAKQKQFDWDELKTAYNGRSVRSRGVKNSGNDTYEPPFRGALVISQNAAVNASEAILQRIVHLNFTRAGHTPRTKQLSDQLAMMPMHQVSGFILKAALAERQILDVIQERTPFHETALAALPEIRVPRIAKNHAQIMALLDALGERGLNILPESTLIEARKTVVELAIERQLAVSADHPVVQEFWEAYDYLEGLGVSTVLNHLGPSSHQIAVNLKHFEQIAAEKHLRVPTTAELKRHLRSSRSRKFIDANKTVRSVLRNNDHSASVKCWVFQKESSEGRN